MLRNIAGKNPEGDKRQMTAITNKIGTTIEIGVRAYRENFDRTKSSYIKNYVVRRIYKGEVYLIETPKMSRKAFINFVFDLAIDNPVYCRYLNDTMYLTIDSDEFNTREE